MASALGLVAGNFATSLLVGGSAAPHRLAELTRGTLVRWALVVVPGAVLLMLAPGLILSIYGAGYAAHASEVLRLLAAGSLPYGLVTITFALDRIAGRVDRVARTQLAVACSCWAELAAAEEARHQRGGNRLGGGYLIVASPDPTLQRRQSGRQACEQGSASRSGALDQLGEGGRRADRRKHDEHQARLGPVADTSGLANQDAEAQAEGYGQDGPFQRVTERKQPD